MQSICHRAGRRLQLIVLFCLCSCLAVVTKLQFYYQFQKNFHWKLFHIFKWAKSLYPAKKKGFAEARLGSVEMLLRPGRQQGIAKHIWGHEPAFVQGTANGSTLQVVGE